MGSCAKTFSWKGTFYCISESLKLKNIGCVLTSLVFVHIVRQQTDGLSDSLCLVDIDHSDDPFPTTTSASVKTSQKRPKKDHRRLSQNRSAELPGFIFQKTLSNQQ